MGVTTERPIVKPDYRRTLPKPPKPKPAPPKR